MYHTLKRQIIPSFLTHWLPLSLFYLLPAHILILLSFLDSYKCCQLSIWYISFSGVFLLLYSLLCYCKN